MSYASIQVNPVTPRLGAEIANINLAAPLSNQQVKDLHTALAVRAEDERAKTAGVHRGVGMKIPKMPSLLNGLPIPHLMCYLAATR